MTHGTNPLDAGAVYSMGIEQRMDTIPSYVFGQSR
jgi:hypothetical protein